MLSDVGNGKQQIASIFLFLQFFNSAMIFEAVTAKKLPINTWLQNLLRLPPNILCGMIPAYDSNLLVFMTCLHGMLPSTQQSSTADTFCLNSTVFSIFFFHRVHIRCGFDLLCVSTFRVATGSLLILVRMLYVSFSNLV